MAETSPQPGPAGSEHSSSPAAQGPEQSTDLLPEQYWDRVATDFEDLANRLGL